MRFLYLIMCFLGFSLTLHAVAENEIEPEDPSTQVIVSQLQRINLTPEDLAEYLQDNDAMDYMRHRVGEDIPPGLIPVFRHFKKNPRALFNLCAGALIGGSASWAWARVFTHFMNPAYYVFSKITNHPIYQTAQIGYPAFAMVLLPEIIHNTGVVRRIKRRPTLKNLCEEPKSKAQKALIWTNRLACSLLLAKFFKVYYSVSWQIDHESDEHFTTAADYWLLATYLFSNWWKKYDIFNHKIHWILHQTAAHKDARRHQAIEKIQGRLAAAYRALQQGEERELLNFAVFAHQLNKHATNEEEKQQAMLGILSYLYGLEDGMGNAYAGTFARPKNKPLSLKIAEGTGKVAGGLLLPAAFLGAYYTWDSVLNILEDNEHWDEHEDRHYTDAHMHRPDAWIYALTAAAYSGFSGWHTGAVWGRNLWCRWMRQDPNQYEEHLQYWPQNLKGFRTLTGGGLTYIMSSFLMLPIAGLSVEQVAMLGGSTKLCSSLLLTTFQWGILLDTAFMNPCYQELIGHIGRGLKADTMGTIKDDTLKLIANLHYGAGRLKTQKLIALQGFLEQLDAKRKDVIAEMDPVQDQLSPLVTNPEDQQSLDADDIFDDTRSTLIEPLIPGSPYAETKKPSMFARVKNWFVGAPIPANLQDLARQAQG